jgi:O-antigen ligase
MLSKIFTDNRWFWAFFILCGLSCLWSDYAFTSFKRYIKDVGNVIMVIIIITEIKPEKALKAILARYTYLAIPLSVLFILYFPEFGRYYDQNTYQVIYSGIKTNKNGLGQIAFICGTFLSWDIITTLTRGNGPPRKLDILVRFILLFMVIWLLYMAHSSTAILCMILGIFIVILLNTSFAEKKVRNLGTWTLVLFLSFIIIFTVPGLLKAFAGLLGRDASLTGRTDIWQALLAQSLNPLFGSGYQSFWQTPTAARLGEKFYFIVNQAHNGYLEVYIQTGLISLLFLIGAIITAWKKLKEGLLLSSKNASLLFAFFIIILISNWTEATFNKLNILWFLLIVALLYSPSDKSRDSIVHFTESLNKQSG